MSSFTFCLTAFTIARRGPRSEDLGASRIWGRTWARCLSAANAHSGFTRTSGTAILSAFAFFAARRSSRAAFSSFLASASRGFRAALVLAAFSRVSCFLTAAIFFLLSAFACVIAADLSRNSDSQCCRYTAADASMSASEAFL